MIEASGYVLNGNGVYEIKLPGAVNITAEVKDGKVVVRWQSPSQEKVGTCQ